MQNFIQQSGQKHLFAFFTEALSSAKTKTITISERIFCQRLLQINRLTTHDQCILFSSKLHALGTIVDFDTKKQTWITFLLEPLTSHATLHPIITLYIALCKKNNWPEILYAAAQMGIQNIQPIHTERSRTEVPPHDRTQNLMIAACEQSKQFSLPTLHPPCFIENIPPALKEFRWLADPLGSPMPTKLATMQNQTHLAVAIGPEAGFTQKDRKLLEEKEFISLQLTPTILRTIDAVPLALGIMRTFCT